MEVRVPTGVTSLTLAVSGVKAVTNGIISGVNDVEGTQLVQAYNRPQMSNTTNMSTGTVNLKLPPQITSITISGSTYAVNGGIAADVAAAHATTLFSEGWFQSGFRPGAA